MGCLKLIYSEEPILLLEEQGSENIYPSLEVWVNPERDFLRVGEEDAQQGGAHWWFDDKQGEILGMHWLNGSGKPLVFNDKSWKDYMEANSVIGGTIAGIIHDDARNRTKSGVIAKRIFVELAENDRSTGYGMLHGTQNFDYVIKATVLSNKQIEYSATFTWNDRINPSERQGDSPWVTVASLFYNPADYDVTIKWSHTYIIDK